MAYTCINARFTYRYLLASQVLGSGTKNINYIHFFSSKSTSYK